MKENSLLQNGVVRAALVTGGLLLIPLVGMQVSDDVNWTLGDFIVMGTLIFGAGLLVDFASKKADKNRVAVIALIIFLFLWLWAELAVGIFTNWGS